MVSHCRAVEMRAGRRHSLTSATASSASSVGHLSSDEDPEDFVSPRSSLGRRGRSRRWMKKKVSWSSQLSETLRVPMQNGARLTPLCSARGLRSGNDSDESAERSMASHLDLLSAPG